MDTSLIPRQIKAASLAQDRISVVPIERSPEGDLMSLLAMIAKTQLSSEDATRSVELILAPRTLWLRLWIRRQFTPPIGILRYAQYPSNSPREMA
jgi:hypothetical protein